MNLAAIFGISLLGLALLSPIRKLSNLAGFATSSAGLRDTATQINSAPASEQSQDGSPPAQTSAPQKSATPASPVSGTKQNPGTAKKTSHKNSTKKAKNSDCSASASAQPKAGPNNNADPKAASAKQTATSSPLPSCPPTKTVVRDGGSEEPTIQLVGGATAAPEAEETSTEQLKDAAEENLKKIANRELSSSQQEMVSQIQHFLDQSKTAVSEGDLDSAHSFALKARMLSDDLVKP